MIPAAGIGLGHQQRACHLFEVVQQQHRGRRVPHDKSIKAAPFPQETRL